MKRSTVLALAILAAPLCLEAATFTVQIAPGGSLSFDPASQTINVGDTVTWIWGIGFHSTTSGSVLCLADDTWNSDVQGAPHSFSVTFGSPGTFSYFCLVHCGFGMTGEIVVQGVTGTPTETPTETPTPTTTQTQAPTPLTPTSIPPLPAAVPTLSATMSGLLALALTAAALLLMKRP